MAISELQIWRIETCSYFVIMNLAKIYQDSRL